MFGLDHINPLVKLMLGAWACVYPIGVVALIFRLVDFSTLHFVFSWTFPLCGAVFTYLVYRLAPTDGRIYWYLAIWILLGAALPVVWYRVVWRHRVGGSNE